MHILTKKDRNERKGERRGYHIFFDNPYREKKNKINIPYVLSYFIDIKKNRTNNKNRKKGTK